MDAFIDHEANLESYGEEVHMTIEQIVRAISGKQTVTSGYIQALSSFLMQFVRGCVARDLLAFSAHADRKNIQPDDVVLLARKTKYHDTLEQMKESIVPKSPKMRKSKS